MRIENRSQFFWQSQERCAKKILVSKLVIERQAFSGQEYEIIFSLALQKGMRKFRVTITTNLELLIII
jgi:hypothetical protein